MHKKDGSKTNLNNKHYIQLICIYTEKTHNKYIYILCSNCILLYSIMLTLKVCNLIDFCEIIIV